jgi:hypothetical protein
MGRMLADEKPGFITTCCTRQVIDLMKPDPAVLFIEDCAHSFALQNRFVGHTARPYSVGEHILLGLEYVTPWDRFEWLMHEGPETVLADVSKPFKHAVGMSFYRGLEAEWQDAYRHKFGLKKVTPGCVATVDGRMLVTEMRDLQGRRPMWRDKAKPFPMLISQATPSWELVEREFLEAFDRLSGQTEGAKR